MRVIIQSESDVSDLFKGLELLTNAAEVTLADIKIDESRKEITIPLKRKIYERKRSLFFGERYELLSSELIESELIVRKFIAYQRKDNFPLQHVHLLFGVAIENKDVRLYSADEQAGVTAFVMSIKVQTYDIELRDKQNSN